MAAALIVRPCTQADAQVWDAFVADRVGGTYCHAFSWSEIIKRAQSLRSAYLRVEGSDGQWQGVFPVVIHPGFRVLPGRATSVAFCNHGDVLVSPSASTDAVRGACLKYLVDHGEHTVEVRPLDWQAGQTPEVSLFLDLPSEPAGLWKQIGQKTRTRYAKARNLAWFHAGARPDQHPVSNLRRQHGPSWYAGALACLSR